ncbi:MAG: hypothetical protein AAGH79_09930 [Bacteroidota bacterium]
MWFKRLLLILTASYLCLLLIVQFPQWFISEQSSYGPFKMYAGEPLSCDLPCQVVLDSAHLLLKQSAFYQADQVFELYFVQGTLYEKLISLFGTKNIASSKHNKHLYIGRPDFQNGILRQGDHPYQWLNLVQIISHEGVHSQMYTDYAKWWGSMQTPAWLNEGYCEYIAYQPFNQSPHYQLRATYDRYRSEAGEWVQTEHGAYTPKIYLRDRIVMEYLLLERGEEIHSIIGNPTYNPDVHWPQIVERFR